MNRSLKVCLTIIILFYACQVQKYEVSSSKKVIVIGVDGLTVDGIEKGDTPNIDFLIQKGQFTLNAQAVMPTKSSPNWMSMLSGVSPEKHQFKKNGFDKNAYRNNPTCDQSRDFFPTIFNLLKEQRPDEKTAIIHQWRPIKNLVNPNDVSYRRNPFLFAGGVARKGLKYFKYNQPSLLFLHFNLVDLAGHLSGYTSQRYYRKVEQMDGFLKEYLELAGKDPNLYILLVSDHGGIGKDHGGDTPEELTVPFIVYNTNLNPKEISKAISNIDVAPTIVDILQLEKHICWDGKSALE